MNTVHVEGERVTIDKALSIQGWMLQAELLWLAQEARKHTCIVEIGSFHGRSTAALAANVADGGHVHAIDDFHGPRDERCQLTQTEREAIYGEFKKNMAQYGDRVMVMRCDHKVAVDAFASANRYVGCRPTMVFIDGSHEFEDVCRDIRDWLPMVSRPGVICGHDWDSSNHGVRGAVTGLLSPPRGGDTQIGLLNGGSIWVKELR